MSQFSKENRKFKYSEIKKNARAIEYENALGWLIAGNYLTKVTIIDKLNLPLRGHENIKHFKIYMSDIGLLRRMSDYPVSALFNSKNKNIPFKGALVENYVLQELQAVYDKKVFYLAKNNYELDFIIQLNDEIVAIEVKSGENTKSNSLKKILGDRDFGIRISMKNLKKDGKIVNIPLVLVSEIERLVL